MKLFNVCANKLSLSLSLSRAIIAVICTIIQQAVAALAAVVARTRTNLL